MIDWNFSLILYFDVVYLNRILIYIFKNGGFYLYNEMIDFKDYYLIFIYLIIKERFSEEYLV